MRILLVSPHFHPENFKCNDVAFELSRRGHEVTVLSDIPNYPGGHFFRGYGLFRRRRERVAGVDIVRVAVVPRGDAGPLRLALNYASFVLTGTAWAVWLALTRRFDAVLVHETSPVTVGIPALLVKKWQRIPLYFWVLDLWPESLTAAGGVRNRYVLSLFARLARTLYRHSRRILISSRGFEESICAKGPFVERIEYFPNWPDKAFSSHADYSLPPMPEGFIVMFAGNIGEAQDFESLMAAALRLKDERGIHFVLVGDGRKKPWVDRFVQENGLQATVHCLGRHPLESMPKFFASADAMIVSLKDEMIFRLTAPAKLQAYMSAGKPILGMISGEGNRLIAEARCGMAVDAGQAEAFAGIVRRMAAMTEKEREELGRNGLDYGREHFDFCRSMDKLESWLDADTEHD